LLAMRRALDQLSLAPEDVVPEEVLVDGLHCPPSPWPVRAVVKGDAKVKAISAASILAKVARDAAMQELHAQRPEYGFDRHKGYATEEHLEALRRHGPCEVYRRSFAPVKDLLDNGGAAR
jgi:ribonuclease HII